VVSTVRFGSVLGRTGLEPRTRIEEPKQNRTFLVGTEPEPDQTVTEPAVRVKPVVLLICNKQQTMLIDVFLMKFHI